MAENKSVVAWAGVEDTGYKGAHGSFGAGESVMDLCIYLSKLTELYN